MKKLAGFLAAILKKLRPGKNPAPMDIIPQRESGESELLPAAKSGFRYGANMQTLEEILTDYMIDNDVDPYTAEQAARKCATAVKLYGAGGAAIGATAGYLTANPATLLMTAVGGAGGAMFCLLHSPSCGEVREAAQRWANARLP